MKRLYLLAGIIGVALHAPRAAAAGEDLLFFCGAAAKVPMEEIVAAYGREKGVKVAVTYGGSGALLSQMRLSRRGDVYLCGSPDYVAIGEEQGLLRPGTDRRIAYLVPAIIVPAGNPARIASLDDLARPGVRVAIGNPETVCLGLYAVELLERNGLLEKVLRDNVAVFAKSCEDVAMLAAAGRVDASIGWDVFKTWTPDRVEWIRIAPDRIPRIAYMAMAVPVSARDAAASADFISWCAGERGARIFSKWGSIAEEAAARRHAPGASIGGVYALPPAYYRIARHER
ncbi:MAG: molybdate ABC transporter substrate-binding protein [bacterium]|nr:molybdate ABC transporter substrate-binding protein [bacterium]